MANLKEEAIWQDVYEINNNDLVLGRKNSNTLGPSNIPLQQLVNRDAYLNNKIDTKPAIPLWDMTKDDYLKNISFVHYVPTTGSVPHIYMCIEDTTVAGFPPETDTTHWVDLTPSAGVLLAPIGMIQAMPFREDNLPLGWIPCDGHVYSISTWIGGRLANLPQQFKTDHGINIDQGKQTVNAPDKITPPISGENLYGRFVRYGASEHVGKQGRDAIRNIVGGAYMGSSNATSVPNEFPQYKTDLLSQTRYGQGLWPPGSSGGLAWSSFDASRVVPTDTENVPCYEVALPCIYLGDPPAGTQITHRFTYR